MKTKLLLSFCTVFLAGGFLMPSDAKAQFAPRAPVRQLRRSTQPPVSPYLDMLGGAGLGTLEFQYLRRVRPEQQFRAQQQKLDRGLQTVQNEVRVNSQNIQANREAIPVPNHLTPSGHSATFGDYGGYYDFRR